MRLRHEIEPIPRGVPSSFQKRVRAAVLDDFVGLLDVFERVASAVIKVWSAIAAPVAL